jgi:PAS domain S-box-containing protein
MIGRVPLRVAIPAVLALTGLAQAAALVVYDRVTEPAAMEAVNRERVAALGTRLAPVLENSLAEGDLLELRRVVLMLRAEPFLNRAIVLDERDQPLADTTALFNSTTSPTHPPSALAAAAARQRGAVALNVTPDLATLTAAFPLSLPKWHGELRPSESAVLYLELDLDAQRQVLDAASLRRGELVTAAAIGFALLSWMYLSRSVTRRVESLVALARKFSLGDYSARTTVRGTDELGMIAVAFNAMASDVEQQATAIRDREQALRASEQRYSTLVDNVDGIVWEADARTFQFTFVSAQAERLLGYPLRRWIDEPTFWADHIHPDDRDQAVSFCVTSTARLEAHDFQYRMLAADGREVWLHDVVAIESANGAPVILRGIMVDVTARKHAEMETRLFRERVEMAGDAIYVIDPRTGRLLDVNERACVDLGYTRTELLERNVLDLDPAADATTFPANLEKLRTRGPIQLEVTHRTKDGRSIPVDVSISLVSTDRDYLVAVGRNVSDRKRAERALHEAQAEATRLADFPRLNPDPVFELTDTAGTAYSNEAALRMATSLGLASPAALLPPSAATLVRTALASGADQKAESVQGSRTLLWEFHPILPRRVVHARAYDITDRRQVEGQLRQAQKMEAVGLLAGGIAHDFNNLLTVIQGHAALLDSTGALPADDMSLAAIAEASKRAADLTQQLLTFAHKHVIRPTSLRADAVVEHTARLLRRVIGEDIDLVLSSEPALPLIHADQGMLEQLVMNLALNARDAMPRGGRLTIHCAAVESGPDDLLRPTGVAPGRFVCVSVADTGTGIQPTDVEHIFEPFFTTKDVGKGTGLGLATVYAIAQQHGGWVTVSTRVGEGSEFRVFVPVVDTEEGPEPAQGTEQALAGAQGETVLLVEDEASVRRVATRILQGLGYRVIEAASGPEALTLVDQADVLVTDVVMPGGISGRELVEHLRVERPHLRVLYMSGYSTDLLRRDRDRTYAHFLQKPFTRDSLARAVRACLDADADADADA